MDTKFKEIEYKEHTIELHYDECCQKPKDAFDDPRDIEIAEKAYRNGEVYGWLVDGVLCSDSCWGYYGFDEIDYMIKEAKEMIDYSIEQEQRAISFVNNHFAL